MNEKKESINVDLVNARLQFDTLVQLQMEERQQLIDKQIAERQHLIDKHMEENKEIRKHHGRIIGWLFATILILLFTLLGSVLYIASVYTFEEVPSFTQEAETQDGDSVILDGIHYGD